MQHFDNGQKAMTTAILSLEEAAEFFFIAMHECRTEPFSNRELVCLQLLLDVKASLKLLHANATSLRKQGPKPLPETADNSTD